jgi:hypothetical protein
MTFTATRFSSITGRSPNVISTAQSQLCAMSFPQLEAPLEVFDGVKWYVNARAPCSRCIFEQ